MDDWRYLWRSAEASANWLDARQPQPTTAPSPRPVTSAGHRICRTGESSNSAKQGMREIPEEKMPITSDP